jgi:putative transposase
VLIPGATYFSTVNTYQRQRVLTAEPFLSGAEAKHHSVKRAHPFTIEAFVLLPVHLH